MVRSFGWLLILGVAVAFVLALTAGLAALALGRDRTSPSDVAQRATNDRGVGAPRPVAWILRLALNQPLAVLGVGLALAILGWGLGTRISTVSDIRDLAPQSLPAVKGLDEVQEATGVSGELDVSIEAEDLAAPATIEWMAGFKRRVLAQNGFSGEDPSCLTAEVCPGPALSDFLTRGEGKLTAAGIGATLKALSPYALRQVAPREADGKLGHSALITFGIRAQSLEDQGKLVDRVREAIGTPPPGVEVKLAGLSVIAAESAADLSSSRYWLALGGLVAVAVALLLVYRSPRRALVPLAPTVLATGWASLLLWVSGIPLNPMSAALGALTIAIATEFGVILSGRFHQERRASRSVDQALERAYARTGAAVLASALTAIAGFAVLVASDIQMLRDFGVVTVIDLSAALLGVMIVLPAALVALEDPRDEGAGVRDRWTLLVGAIFLAIIVVATLNTLGGGSAEETLGLDKQPARWPLPEFAVPAAPRAARRRRQRLPGRLRPALDALSEDSPRVPACGIDAKGAIRVCDLFDRPLVLSFWFGTEGGCSVNSRVVARSPALPWAGELPSLDVRDPRGSFANWSGTGVGDAGRVRPRRRRGRALPRRRLPDLRLRLPRRHPAERRERRTERRAAESAPRRTAGGDPAAEGGDGAEQRRGRADRWEPAPSRAGSRHTRGRVPRPRWRRSRSTGGPGHSPEPVCRRLRDLSDRLFGAEAIRLRGRPIPWAYRVFFRQIGLDPDRDRTPVEQLVLDRLQDGGFKPRAAATR